MRETSTMTVLTELSKDFVTINNSGFVINGKKNTEIQIVGLDNVINKIDAYVLRTLFVQENGHPILSNELIRISKKRNNELLYCPARVFYADIDMYKNELGLTRLKRCDEWFRFNYSIKISENESLSVKIVNFKGKLSKEKTKFAFDCNIIDKEV